MTALKYTLFNEIYIKNCRFHFTPLESIEQTNKFDSLHETKGKKTTFQALINSTWCHSFFQFSRGNILFSLVFTQTPMSMLLEGRLSTRMLEVSSFSFILCVVQNDEQTLEMSERSACMRLCEVFKVFFLFFSPRHRVFKNTKLFPLNFYSALFAYERKILTFLKAQDFLWQLI